MKYERIKYPDSQVSTKLLDLTAPYHIKERINSYEDLMFVRSIAEVLEYQNIKNRHLEIPCLFGQRSDRRFSPMQSFDLKVIAEVINACHFMTVQIFDPHSQDALTAINQSCKLSPIHYVRQSLAEIDNTREDGTGLILVSPDTGAYKKVFEIGQEINLPVVAAVKHRDLQGKIDLQFFGNVKGKECLILDDILDGGWTFHLLAEKLKEQGAMKVYLYVSHAYFNKGVEFTPHIDHFFCTNSVKDINHSKVTQYKYV